MSIHCDKNTINFDFIGHSWKILRADMESLWEEMVENSQKENGIKENSANEKDKELDERLPYFAELWPSSLGLAEFLAEKKEFIEHKKSLDLGCGLGFTALCGAFLGAKVLGVDYEEKAILLAKENAKANEFSLLEHDTQANLDFQVMDWRYPILAPRSQKIIWAADIVYEKAFFQAVLNFLDFSLADDGLVWLAEPGRSIFNDFPKLVQSHGFSMEKVKSSQSLALSAQIPSATVNIWEIKRK